MKIGILIADFDTLQHFELKILKHIIDDPTLEIAVLMKDGRQTTRETSLTGKIKRFIQLDKWFALLVLKIQLMIESRIFRQHNTVDKDEIISYLNTLPVIELNPKSKGFLDIFGKEDAELVKSFGLDIILRHEFRIIRGEILTAAKHGIWSFHHADNSINRGAPPCFWEIVLKQPYIGVTLQQLTTELDGGLVIDKGFYDRGFSYYLTKNDVYNSSVSLLFKNIKKLQQNRLTTSKSTVYYNPLYKSPSIWYVIKYLSIFYGKIASIFINRLLYILGIYREDCWTLFIGKGNFMDAALYKLKPQKLPANEFWADPFLFRKDEETYIFFENYNYKTKRAKISCGKVSENRITDIKDALNLDYHLSYPFVFEEDGKIFMIPETSNAMRMEIYCCSDFPHQWELYATAFEGESVGDVSYYRDEDGQRWLFLIKGESNNELYIYRIGSLKLESIEPHSLNPVIIDSRVARCGGAIFKQDGKLYRPSQCNIKNVYGYGLNINRIKKLTIDEYEEERTVAVEPNFKKGITATHHLHQIDGMYVIDACYKRYR